MGDAGEIGAGIEFDGRRVGKSFRALFRRLVEEIQDVDKSGGGKLGGLG